MKKKVPPPSYLLKEMRIDPKDTDAIPWAFEDSNIKKIKA